MPGAHRKNTERTGVREADVQVVQGKEKGWLQILRKLCKEAR